MTVRALYNRVWDGSVNRLEGKVNMGIDIVDLVDTIRDLGIAYVVPIVKAISARYFVAISDLT